MTKDNKELKKWKNGIKTEKKSEIIGKTEKKRKNGNEKKDK